MKISPRQRERAAVLCSMAACREWNGMRMYEIADNLRYPALGAARLLAFLALAHVNAELHFAVGENRYAEAESLIRTGWVPRGGQ